MKHFPQVHLPTCLHFYYLFHQETINTGPFVMRSTCRRCGGRGSIITNPCVICRGAGQAKQKKRVMIPVPAGGLLGFPVPARAHATISCEVWLLTETEIVSLEPWAGEGTKTFLNLYLCASYHCVLLLDEVAASVPWFHFLCLLSSGTEARLTGVSKEACGWSVGLT